MKEIAIQKRNSSFNSSKRDKYVHSRLSPVNALSNMLRHLLFLLLNFFVTVHHTEISLRQAPEESGEANRAYGQEKSQYCGGVISLLFRLFFFIKSASLYVNDIKLYYF